jgi:taurine dioxygenase
MIDVRKLGAPLLAEVVGLDITQPIDRETWPQVNRAFLDHCVLVFRDQALSPDQMVRFARQFGTVEPHITKKYRHPDCEELIVMTNLNERGEVDAFETSRGGHWHTDMCYRQVPSKATMLHTLEIPERGGDTLFANMYLALETMPAALREKIDGRRATFRYGGRQAEGQLRLEPKDRNAPLVDHSIVKPHTETGRLSLFVNPAHTVGIVGMMDDEAIELLEEIYAWCARPEFQARHEWRMGDTVIWDNRCTWHRATGDNPLRQPRRLLRGTIADQTGEFR